MKVYSTALSVALATFAITTSIPASFADSEAGSSAGSQASTMNNSQEARETTTQAQSSHGSQGAVHQRSEARTVNETENDGKSEKPYNNAQAPAGIPAVNGRRANTPVSSKVGNTQAVGAKPAVAHVPHAVTRSYHWRNSKSYSSRSRLASRSSMTRTVQQAARTH